MKFLIFADLHTFDKNKLKLIKDDFDIIVTLGDIRPPTIREIMLIFPQKEIFAILGNHDDIGMLKSVNRRMGIEKQYGFYNGNGIKDINLIKIEKDNIRFTGIEGCSKYRLFQPGYTQKESIELNIPKADILFSHDTGYRYMEKQDLAHVGLKGISKYIEENNPKYHIFGHYHINKTFIIKETKCFCVYGCSLFDYEMGEMKNIFGR